MSAFKDMVARDIHSVFLDTNFFGEKRTVEYDGERYEDIPVVLMEAEEKDRSKLEDDHVQGLYFVSDTLQCALSDLGGKLPERDSASVSTTRRAAGDSSGSSTSSRQPARWGCSM